MSRSASTASQRSSSLSRDPDHQYHGPLLDPATVASTTPISSQ
jgi:hypothetical protein